MDRVGRLLRRIEKRISTEDFGRFITGLIAGPIRRHHRSAFWGDRLLTLDKEAGFLDDPRFAAALAKVQASHRYDQYDSPNGIAWRLHILVWAARRGLRIAGDFVECGVFKGDMSWVVCSTIDFARQLKTFYLYDTFAGFPEHHRSPADFPDDPEFSAFAHRTFNDPSLYPAVIERFRDFPNVRVVRGPAPESVAAEGPARIAYLHVDLNSSKGAGVLEALFGRVSPGAAVVLDDYGWRQFRVQRDVADAFFRARGHEVLELPTGQGLVIKCNEPQ